MTPRFFTSIALVHTAFILAASATSAQTYSVTDLGTLDLGSSHACAINDRGDVAGHTSAPSLVVQAFLWTPAAGMQGLPVPGGRGASLALGIDDAATVAGYAGLASEDSLATVTPRGARRPRLLTGLAGESWARGIDSSGRIAGESEDAAGLPRAVWWDRSGRVHDLGGVLNARLSNAAAISDTGLIVGRADGRPYVVDIGVGVPTFLTSLGPICIPNDVNDSGIIVGSSNQTSGLGCTNCDTRAVLWRGDVITILGTLAPPGTPRMFSSAYGLNEREQVVGRSTVSGGASRGFVWSTQTGMLDLNALVPPGWIIAEAWDINNAGQIAATGAFGGGSLHALRLDPVELEPVVISPQPGLAGTRNRIEVLNASRGGLVALVAGAQPGILHLPVCGAQLGVVDPLVLGIFTATFRRRRRDRSGRARRGFGRGAEAPGDRSVSAVEPRPSPCRGSEPRRTVRGHTDGRGGSAGAPRGAEARCIDTEPRTGLDDRLKAAIRSRSLGLSRAAGADPGDDARGPLESRDPNATTRQ